MKRLFSFSLILALIVSLGSPGVIVFAIEDIGLADTSKLPEVEVGTTSLSDTEGAAQSEAAVAIEDIGDVDESDSPLAPEPLDQSATLSVPGVIPSVVIAQIQVGVSGGANNEYVSLYNNETQEVDVTGWCLRNKGGVLFACLSQEDYDYRIAPGAFISFSTTSRVDEASIAVLISSCGSASGCIVGSSDAIQLVDGDIVIDTISWTAQPSGMYAIEREWNYEAFSQLHSGNGKGVDWVWKKSLATFGHIDEPIECSDGSFIATSGRCPVPPIVCKNRPDIEVGKLPPNLEVDQDGNCYENQCVNLPGFYSVLPNDFVADEDGRCFLSSSPLEVTELLINPKGVDGGNEYIEIYNPNDKEVSLAWWQFYLNDESKVYKFPDGSTISAREYLIIRDNEANFSLRNSSGSLRMTSIDGQYSVEVPSWANAKEGKSWAVVDGMWGYADPSPGEENLFAVSSLLKMVDLADCGEGRERNPLTGRCRNIPTPKELIPCKDGQYRSEETGRCRNIALAGDTLKPCKEGQYRSEETNRCRSIALAAKILKPCADDEFRNPATNRCRKILASSMPKIPFAPEKIEHISQNTLGWWALGGASLLAVGYAGWQWRFEVSQLTRRLSKVFASTSK